MKPNRYQKQLKLKGFGPEGQEKLSKSKVLIIGAGGLGTPVAQYLNAMGVGTLGLVDQDTVEESNLPRQTLYGPADVGQYKTDVLIRQLQKQNPETHLVNYREFLSPENALSLIGSYDLVVDATDNFGTRYLVNDACVILNKPFVYGAIQDFEGQVSVLNYQDGPTYRCLFPEADAAGFIPNCDENGVLGVLPGLIGTYQALEAVKVLTGIGKTLSGKLLIVDTLSQTHLQVGVPLVPENKSITKLKPYYKQPVCASEQLPTIAAEELQNWMQQQKPMEIIDVRNPSEFARHALPSAHNIPLSELAIRKKEIKGATPVVLVCQSGKRSIQALKFLQELRPELSYFNLEGGMNSILVS